MHFIAERLFITTPGSSRIYETRSFTHCLCVIIIRLIGPKFKGLVTEIIPMAMNPCVVILLLLE